MSILLKRAREKPLPSDGTRVLVDRAWPRGVERNQARLHAWLRDLAPSDHLRRWFNEQGAPPELWQRFRRRYLGELCEPAATQALEELYRLATQRANLTLVHAARDTEHNGAAVLKELLEGTRKPPSSAGAAVGAASGVRARRAVRR
ncbi:MAG: DUF488 domain-containing protein [Terriglobales bacterium]